MVGAGSGFGVGVIASQSSNSQQFSQPVQTGQNQGSNQQQNSQNGHATQGNQQKWWPTGPGVVLKVARKEVDLVKCHRKAMVALKGMVQKIA
ncbi:MAG: hypothetical protein ACLRZG_07215 [Streptococcus sp.]